MSRLEYKKPSFRDLLNQKMSELNVDVIELSVRSGFSMIFVRNLLAGKEIITEDVAKKLEIVFGKPNYNVWISSQFENATIGADYCGREMDH